MRPRPEDPVRLKVREWLALGLAAMLLGVGGVIANSCAQGCGTAPVQVVPLK